MAGEAPLRGANRSERGRYSMGQDRKHTGHRNLCTLRMQPMLLLPCTCLRDRCSSGQTNLAPLRSPVNQALIQHVVHPLQLAVPAAAVAMAGRWSCHAGTTHAVRSSK